MEVATADLSIDSAVDALIDIGHYAATRGWVPATAGNFSIRVGALVAITRTSKDKGNLRCGDIAIVPLANTSESDISAEAALHFARYIADPSVRAMFHVHMPVSALLGRLYANEGQFILTGWELQKAFSGVRSHLDPVRIPVLHNDQDIQTLAVLAERELQKSGSGITAPGYLVAGHGVYTWGQTYTDARRHLEAFDSLLKLHMNWLELEP